MLLFGVPATIGTTVLGKKDVALLTEYLQVGGNLILSGASIAFDWDHTEFLNTIAHADYLTFSGQADLEVGQADHPIAEDFDPETLYPLS